MTNIILCAILFCFILLLNGICFAIGFYFGLKKKRRPEPVPLTEEQKKQIEIRQRQDENFWNYNGDSQETI